MRDGCGCDDDDSAGKRAAMNKTKSCFAAGGALVLVCAMLACQPTPTQEVVVNKQDAQYSDEVFSTGWGALTGASCWVVTFGFRLGI